MQKNADMSQVMLLVARAGWQSMFFNAFDLSQHFQLRYRIHTGKRSDIVANLLVITPDTKRALLQLSLLELVVWRNFSRNATKYPKMNCICDIL